MEIKNQDSLYLPLSKEKLQNFYLAEPPDSSFTNDAYKSRSSYESRPFTEGKIDRAKDVVRGGNALYGGAGLITGDLVPKH